MGADLDLEHDFGGSSEGADEDKTPTRDPSTDLNCNEGFEELLQNFWHHQENRLSVLPQIEQIINAAQDNSGIVTQYFSQIFEVYYSLPSSLAYKEHIETLGTIMAAETEKQKQHPTPSL